MLESVMAWCMVLAVLAAVCCCMTIVSQLLRTGRVEWKKTVDSVVTWVAAFASGDDHR
jgi:hypothetical protein